MVDLFYPDNPHYNEAMTSPIMTDAMIEREKERARNKRGLIYKLQVAWYAGCIMEAVTGDYSKKDSEEWLTQIGRCMNKLGVDSEHVSDVIIKTWEHREDGREAVRAVFRRALNDLGTTTF